MPPFVQNINSQKYYDVNLSVLITDAVMARHAVDSAEVFGHLRTVFKGCKDWDGGRKLRMKGIDNL